MQDRSSDSVRLMYVHCSKEALAAAEQSPILTHFTKTGPLLVGDLVKLHGIDKEMRVTKRVWETTPEHTTLFIHLE